MSEMLELTAGLKFPEGPVAMADGSVVVVEIGRGTVTRVGPDGSTDVIAEPGDGPNGAALGPDGKLYVCNNGNAFEYVDREGLTVPVASVQNHTFGRIERIDIDSGEVEVIYTECEGHPLRAPNDLVFDAHGGFYFTDHGLREERTVDRSGVYYAMPDGSSIDEVIFPLDAPNGIGLSPDGSRVYVAETYTACVWWWEIGGAGEVKAAEALLPHGGTLLNRLPGFQYLDSLKVDGDGNVCVATLGSGGITSLSPDDGAVVEFVETGDIFTTNLGFGGEDLRTAYITASGTGRLLATEWPRPGLSLAYAA
jgi:gluconolactonase